MANTAVVYGRDYQGKSLRFEASGGLVHSSLVLQDKETDTYWSIMTGQALAGPLKGTKLVELPVSEKTTWKKWREEHPDTLVLSVGGREDAPDVYARYFQSRRGFRGEQARDDRLGTKEPIFAFRWKGVPYAVRSKSIERGKVIRLDDGTSVFLYRPRKASIFEGTEAYVSSAGFEKKGGVWTELGSGARFDPEAEEFRGGEVARLGGFDTFWYNWSLNNPHTKLLK